MHTYCDANDVLFNMLCYGSRDAHHQVHNSIDMDSLKGEKDVTFNSGFSHIGVFIHGQSVLIGYSVSFYYTNFLDTKGILFFSRKKQIVLVTQIFVICYYQCQNLFVAQRYRFCCALSYIITGNLLHTFFMGFSSCFVCLVVYQYI